MTGHEEAVPETQVLRTGPTDKVVEGTSSIAAAMASGILVFDKRSRADLVRVYAYGPQ